MKQSMIRMCLAVAAGALAVAPISRAQVVPANPDPDPFGTNNEDEYLDTAATGRWWDLTTFPPANYFTSGLFFNKQALLDLVKNQPRDETVAFALYTHDHGVLKLTAQLYPLMEGESTVTYLDLDFGQGWTNVASAAVTYPGWYAQYRIENWDSTLDVPYRVRHKAGAAYNESVFQGLIRHDPVEKNTIVVGVVGCIGQTWTDRLTNMVAGIQAEDPDLMYFYGDQYYINYEHTAGWLNFGLQMKETFRNRPAIVIMDDHDYSCGNLWGRGGAQATARNTTKGGIYWDARYVNMIQTAETSHLPDPYDPTPIDRGIGVYYTRVRVGGIDFAILEDRMWKSGPADPTNFVYNDDAITDTNLDTTTLDKPGLVLLGQRQLDFLNDWGQDWTGAEMKTVLSQTAFASVPHLHGGNFVRWVADLDSNGWPQTPRNNALRAIRRAMALHVCGDQHIPSVVKYGIDDFRDASYGFTVAAGFNSIYPRAWHPENEMAGPNPRAATTLPWTGDYFDGFQNRISMVAYCNPGPYTQMTRRDGHAILRYHKAERQITLESWENYPKTAEVFTMSDGGDGGGTNTIDPLVTQDSVLSNEGTSVPSTNIFAQNLNQTTAGIRPVQWNNATTHSLIGQSFTAVQSGTAQGIALLLDSAESFGVYDTNSFRLKLFQGADSSATLLGTYAYDATGVGNAAAGDWIRFGLGDQGMPLTAGTVYSFLIVNGAEDPDHVTNFERTKEAGDYTGGTELRAGNAYDIANWDTDPWDIASPIGASVAPQTGNLLFFVDGSTTNAPGTNITEIVTGRWQHPGWPITINMEDNDGRTGTHVLPEMVFEGGTDPVVQVIRESDGEILYTERIKGNTWIPKVYAPGTYTVKVGTSRPDQQTFSGITAVPAGSEDQRRVMVSM